MKRSQRVLTRLSLLLLLVLGLSLAASGDSGTASAASGVKKLSGGTFVKIGKQYYYSSDEDTVTKKGLYEINGRTYYLSKTGRRLYGWRDYKGDRYYFGKKSQGYMYKKCWYTDSSGNVYRLMASGKMATGFKKLGGHYYYFDPDTGVRQSGWQEIKGKTYYFSKNTGRARKKPLTKKGVTYYFDSTTCELLYSGADISGIQSDCAVLINADTGEVLYDKNGSAKHANASTTKILTCILALENTSLDDVVTASSNAAETEPTKIYLHAGEKFYMEDLLYGMMLPSGNDAAVAIAEHISGSTKKFAKLMNEKALEIGCTSTHFETPNGLDADYNHYTTALDLAKIARYAYQNKTFRSIVRTRTYRFKSISGYSYSLTNSNTLLGSMSGVTGIKTGYTRKAGYCFVGSIESKNGGTYICVVLGASTSSRRWSDSETLLSYAYNL